MCSPMTGYVMPGLPAGHLRRVRFDRDDLGWMVTGQAMTVRSMMSSNGMLRVCDR